MSIYRQAAKVDKTQRSICMELRSVGIEVWVIKQPCDTLLRFWCNRHRDFCWQTLEIKTPNRKDGTVRPRADQQAQTNFLISTDTPVATSFQDAIRKLNQRHALGISV